MKKLIKVSVTIFVLTISFNTLTAQSKENAFSFEIKKQITNNTIAGLYYPKTIKRFYEQQGFKPAWIKTQSGYGHAWQAMLMLDCVIQYGLFHADYHPKELTYSLLHDILDTPDKTDIKTQAWYDIMLTDAIINFMNNLHYGKLNPYYTKQTIDDSEIRGFDAGLTLAKALSQKDLMNELVAVQPLSKEYLDMLNYMVLLKGRYDGDCYEVPENIIRKLAINMERMRWANVDQSTYIHVNIPSYTLMFHQPDTTYLFKVIVGKPSTPTPTLLNNLIYFTTSREWRVPQKIFAKKLLTKAITNPAYLVDHSFIVYDKETNAIKNNTSSPKKVKNNSTDYFAGQAAGNNALASIVFHFANTHNIWIQDTREKSLFSKKQRDLSSGIISVEQAGKLATLILKNDENADKIFILHKNTSFQKTQTFTLTTLLPVKITYLTCAVVEGEFIAYDDIYNLDKNLEMALYGAYALSKP